MVNLCGLSKVIFELVLSPYQTIWPANRHAPRKEYFGERWKLPTIKERILSFYGLYEHALDHTYNKHETVLN